jgi:hypothetical protein
LLDAATKRLLGEKYLEGIETSAKIGNDYGIPSCRIRSYGKIVSDGGMFSSTRGRGSMIDDESLSKVIHRLSGPISTRPEDFASSLHVAAQETKARQGVSILSAESCRRRTINRIKVNNQLMMKNVEETPDARQVAVYDIYNAISYAAMNHVLVPLCKPQLILNYDATQFRVGYGTNGCVSVVIPETEKNMKHKVMKRKDNKGITAYYIKYMCLISAFGSYLNLFFWWLIAI